MNDSIHELQQRFNGQNVRENTSEAYLKTAAAVYYSSMAAPEGLRYPDRRVAHRVLAGAESAGAETAKHQDAGKGVGAR